MRLESHAGFQVETPQEVCHSEAFAAGALLTMIIDTMAPEAVEQSGAEAGLATILGFALAATLSGMG